MGLKRCWPKAAGPEFANSLRQLTQLEALDLSENPSLSNTDLIAIACLTSLTSLDLSIPEEELGLVIYSSAMLTHMVSSLDCLCNVTLAVSFLWEMLDVKTLLRIAAHPSPGRAAQMSALDALTTHLCRSDFKETADQIQSAPVGLSQLLTFLESDSWGSPGQIPPTSLKSPVSSQGRVL